MDWTLELVMVPVSDVDRSKAFYAEGLGFNIDHDTVTSDARRLVQLTPPRSGCSIAIGTVRPSTGSVDMLPGSVNCNWSFRTCTSRAPSSSSVTWT